MPPEALKPYVSPVKPKRGKESPIQVEPEGTDKNPPTPIIAEKSQPLTKYGPEFDRIMKEIEMAKKAGTKKEMDKVKAEEPSSEDVKVETPKTEATTSEKDIEKPTATTAETPETEDPTSEKTEGSDFESPETSVSSKNKSFSSRWEEAWKWFNRGIKHVDFYKEEYRMRGKEKNLVKLKTEMDGLKKQADAKEKEKERIKSSQERLMKLGATGVEDLELQIKDIDREKSKLLIKANQKQSDFEAVENIMKRFANRRNMVADLLIADYSEKLRPMEKELAILGTQRNVMNFANAVMMMKHKKEATRLDQLEKEKKNLEDGFRLDGWSEKKIRKFQPIINLEKQIGTGHEDISAEQKQQAKQMDEINKKIADMDAEANPYRDKREEFVRVKEGRPIKIEVPTRGKSAGSNETEEIRSHARGESAETPPKVKKTKESRSEGSALELETEIEVGQLIKNWNVVLKEKIGEGAELLNQNNFLKNKHMNVVPEYRMDPAQFMIILEQYEIARNKPMDKFYTAKTHFMEKMNVSK